MPIPRSRFSAASTNSGAKLLDNRADTVDCWLTAVALLVTLIGVGAAIAGYTSFNRSREIEAEASSECQ